MLLSSVILVLQETLEVSLLITVLLAVSYQMRTGITWLPIGMFAGLVLSILYAANTDVIAPWFDYVGQEVVNALLQTLVALGIVVLAWAAFSKHQDGQMEYPRQSKGLDLLFLLSALMASAMAITREGSEIFLYLNGALQQEENMRTILIGSGIGFSIGASMGILLFYGLTGLPRRGGLAISVLVLALFAGNMLSQSTLQLTQADWMPSLQPAWDTSAWMPENSITGQLLYALVGYEATPSAIQITSYLAGVLLVCIVAMNARHFRNRSHQVK